MVQPSLGLHGRDHPGKGMLAHEGVDTHTEEGGKGLAIGDGGRGLMAQPDVVESNDDHEDES